jgi:hypothetical protein
MAKPNYSFEKRQRELAKKKAKDEKLARRQAARAAPDGTAAADATAADPPATATDPARHGTD